MAEKFLTTAEAAEMIGIRERLLKDWRHRGYGPRFHRISPRRVRYVESDVLAFIAASAVSLSCTVPKRGRPAKGEVGHG